MTPPLYYFKSVYTIINLPSNSPMNTQQKTSILKKYISQMEAYQKQLAAKHNISPPQQLHSFQPPDIDLLADLVQHQKEINKVVDGTFESVQGVLGELNQLQMRRNNISKLLDTMTATKEVKRLSYGLGVGPAEIYKNIAGYYQIRQKVFYADKHIQLVEEQIAKVKSQFQKQFDEQLRKTNSDNVSQIAKTLNLIHQNSKGSDTVNTHDHIAKFYVSYLKKELKPYEDDLFKIPIVGTNTVGSYVFFEIAKEIMKVVVNLVNSYRGNIVKIGGEQSLQKVIVDIFAFLMNGIMLQIFVREKKYFQVDSLESRKKSKQAPPKFKDYFNQFSAIWNQILRLKMHLCDQIPESSPLHRGFANKLQNCINTAELVKINSECIEGIKTTTRAQFNKLLQVSPFVISIWQINDDYLRKIVQNYNKNPKQPYDSSEAHDFLLQSNAIFTKTLKKCFETLNMVLIAPVISFTNNVLVQQDSFHAFKELFSRTMERLPSSQPKYYTALVLILNTVPLLPNALKNQLASVAIPIELDSFRSRLQSQVKELVDICEYKVKEVNRSFIESIVYAPWFLQDLKQDYRKCLEKWQGLAHEVNQYFLFQASEVHSSHILAEQFSLKGPKKVLTQAGILALEKEIRSIYMFYQAKGCSSVGSFKKIKQYIQILLAESEQNAKKLIGKFGISDEEEVQKVMLLRAMKVH